MELQKPSQKLGRQTGKELLEQAEDVQLTSLAKERLASFDRETAISHEEMKRKYG